MNRRDSLAWKQIRKDPVHFDAAKDKRGRDQQSVDGEISCPDSACCRHGSRPVGTSSKEIPAIAKAANGVVVSIITSDKNGHLVAQGTGFLVTKDGRIVTNYHVIRGASSAIVKPPDGAFYEVEGVVAFDKARDLAVIKVTVKTSASLVLATPTVYK